MAARRKFRTYQFCYNESLDGFGIIQFCAKTLGEAKKLFYDFCDENDIFMAEGNYNVDIVYNEDDAKVYGKEYA